MHIPNRYDMNYQTRSGLFRRAEGQKLLFLIATIAGFRVGLRLVTKAEPLAPSFTSVGLFHWSASGLPR